MKGLSFVRQPYGRGTYILVLVDDGPIGTITEVEGGYIPVGCHEPRLSFMKAVEDLVEKRAQRLTSEVLHDVLRSREAYDTAFRAGLLAPPPVTAGQS